MTTPSSSDTYSDDFPSDKKTFQCNFAGCGKIFRFKSEITRHNVIHYENRPFPCPHEGCGKTFKRTDALDTHLRLHTQDRPFKCGLPDCDRKFATKAALKYHVLKHKDERSFNCSFPGCDKSFYTKGQLKQHEKAFSYHASLADIKIKEEEEPKESIVKFIKKEDDQSHEVYSSIPRLLPKIEWEPKSYLIEGIFAKKEEAQEKIDNIGKYMIQDNITIKDESDLYAQTTDSNQDDREAVFMGSQGWLPSIQEPSIFFDENELQILDFLKDQAQRGYQNTSFKNVIF